MTTFKERAVHLVYRTYSFNLLICYFQLRFLVEDFGSDYIISWSLLSFISLCFFICRHISDWLAGWYDFSLLLALFMVITAHRSLINFVITIFHFISIEPFELFNSLFYDVGLELNRKKYGF